MHFTAPQSTVQRPLVIRIVDTFLPVEESTKLLGLWLHSPLSFKKHISVLKTQRKEALNLIRVVAHLKWGRDRKTLLMLYRAIVWFKVAYGFIVYGTASDTNLRQLDNIHHSRLLLALGAFCTSPVASVYTEANEAPLKERWLKLSMHYYLKSRACIDNPAHLTKSSAYWATKRTCSFLLDTKQLWHWGKRKSWPASKRDTGPRYQPSGRCPLWRFEATCQFLHRAVGSSQMGCGCTWPKSLSLAYTGATQEMKAPNRSKGGCNHPTSN